MENKWKVGVGSKSGTEGTCQRQDDGLLEWWQVLQRTVNVCICILDIKCVQSGDILEIKAGQKWTDSRLNSYERKLRRNMPSNGK